MPAVSVLMYVKNGMPYFKRAIRSVLEQTLREIEVLVIDGGSTDGTIELASRFQQVDGRVRLLHCGIGSVGAQFNVGLREARGEYIGIVESDDYILPEMYEKEYRCAKENDCDVLRADNYIFFGLNGEELKIRTSVSHDAANYGRNLSAESDPDRVFIGGSYWTGIYKREFLLENGIWENETKGAAYQDLGFLLLTSAMARSIYFMKDAFYCYRKDNFFSSCNSPQGIGLVDTEFDFVKENLKARGLWEQYKKYYYLWKIRSERWFYRNLKPEDKPRFIENSYKGILQDLQECDIPDDQWNRKERGFVKAIKASKAEMAAYLTRDDLIWSRARAALQALEHQDNIYIFGAGNLGEIIRKYLMGRNISTKAFIDNNPELWGTEKNDTKIVSPQEAMKSEDAIIIVCSENYAEEITEQLCDKGIAEDRVIICNDMDACVRFIMGR